MKLISSSPPPPPSRRDSPSSPGLAWLRRSLRSRTVRSLFSKQTAWWIFVIIVAVFAYSIVRMFRQFIEANLAQ